MVSEVKITDEEYQQYVEAGLVVYRGSKMSNGPAYIDGKPETVQGMFARWTVSDKASPVLYKAISDYLVAKYEEKNSIMGHAELTLIRSIDIFMHGRAAEEFKASNPKPVKGK